MGLWRDTAVYLGFIEPGTVAVPETRSQASGERVSGALVPPPRPAHSPVSVETALSLGPVYRSINILVTTVASMTVEVKRNGVVIDTPSLVRRPNINDTPSAFIEETVFSLAAHGECFWRLVRSAPGEPVQNVEVLDPAVITVEPILDRDGLDTGKRRYLIGGREVQPSGIKHLKFMRRPGRPHGLGPIQAAGGELYAALRLREFADQWFDVSGVPTGVLETDLVLGPEESARFAQAWKEFLKAHGGTAVLSQGLKYNPVHIKPADAQFLEVQQLVITGIARLFGIPANFLLAEIQGNAMTYQNVEQTAIHYLQTTLSRYMNEIENAFTDLLPRGQTAHFNAESLLRLDAKTKWSVAKVQAEIGYTSGAEMRRLEGKSPLPKDESPAASPVPTPAAGDSAVPESLEEPA